MTLSARVQAARRIASAAADHQERGSAASAAAVGSTPARAPADAGADDVQQEDDIYAVYTPREEFGAVVTALQEAGYTLEERELIWQPQNEVELEKDQALQIMGIIEKLEDLDDVQEVASNLGITDEVAEALAAA